MANSPLLRVTQEHWRKLFGYHFAPNKDYEALSFMFGYVSKSNAGLLICVPHNAPQFLLAADCFEKQQGGYLRLRASVQTGLYTEFAMSGYNGIINIHDHMNIPLPTFSGTDDSDDRKQDRWLRTSFEPTLRREPDLFYRRIFNISLVLAHNGIDARLTDIRMSKDNFVPIAKIEVIGDKLTSITTTAGKKSIINSKTNSIFSRQKDFINPEQQDAMANMSVAVVGAGGLGSSVCEGLARIGVGQIDIIDHDTLSETNLNRWQGGKPQDLGKPKSKVLASRLRKMFPKLSVNGLTTTTFEKKAISTLSRASAIVATVDNSPARHFLNRLSVQHMVPYFDSGVAIKTKTETDFLTRFFSVIPGTTACAECIPHYELIDRQAVANAFMDHRIAKERQASGYVVDSPEAAAPSVYPLNLRATGLILGEFMNWICGWRPLATVVSEHWNTGKIERSDRENFPCNPAPDCPICSFYAGIGFSQSLPSPRNAASTGNSITTTETVNTI
jgi:molybdopterin/thiamine biosynthesis adenylyltransferase